MTRPRSHSFKRWEPGAALGLSDSSTPVGNLLGSWEGTGGVMLSLDCVHHRRQAGWPVLREASGDSRAHGGSSVS